MLKEPISFPTVLLYKAADLLRFRQLYKLNAVTYSPNIVSGFTKYDTMVNAGVFKLTTTKYKTSFAKSFPKAPVVYSTDNNDVNTLY